MQRILMPTGHTELSLGGHNYKIDETGAFEVPAEHVKSLIESHGAVIEAGEAQLGANVDAADAAVGHAKSLLEQKLNEQKAARAALGAFQARQKALDDDRAKAAIAKVEAEKAATAAAEKIAREAQLAEEAKNKAKGGGK
jgi:hypothetical protein